MFLIGWLRFVDRPGLGTLGIGGRALPADRGLSSLFRGPGGLPRRLVRGLVDVWSGGLGARSKLASVLGGWGFGLLVLPGPGGFVFRASSGRSGKAIRWLGPRSEFNQFGAPIWSSFVPSRLHALGQLVTPDVLRPDRIREPDERMLVVPWRGDSGAPGLCGGPTSSVPPGGVLVVGLGLDGRPLVGLGASDRRNPDQSASGLDLRDLPAIPPDPSARPRFNLFAADLRSGPGLGGFARPDGPGSKTRCQGRRSSVG